MQFALVTGGTRGLGLAIALRLARDGFHVVVTYAHDATQAAQAVAQAAADGLALSAVRCDAACAADWQTARDTGGFLEGKNWAVLVHAAGFTRDKLAGVMPPADFDAVLGVHLRGAFLATQAVMKSMIAARSGRIIFVGSPTARLGRRGQTAYGAAKAGLQGLMLSLVTEVSRFQITCNCLCAGLVDTALTAELSEKVRAELLAAIPMGRAGQAQEIAEAASFLASRNASYITGEWFAVDGGLETASKPGF